MQSAIATVMLCLVCSQPRAVADATIDLIADPPGPHKAGQTISVDIFLTTDEAVSINLRGLQFDFSNSDAALLLDSTLVFDYSGCAVSCEGSWWEGADLPVPSNAYALPSENPILQIVLEPAQPTVVARIGLTINATGTLDVVNATQAANCSGAKLDFSTGPGQTPTIWRVDTGELTGGTLSFNLGGDVLFVDSNATGANNGTSWTHAYTSLQDALEDADTAGGAITAIWVAAATYYPDQGAGQTPGDRSATFQLLDAVAIYGGFAGGETSSNQRNVSTNATILSGDILQDDTPVPCTADSPDCDSNGSICGDGGFCIISDNMGENSYHVVTGSGTNVSAILDGFTITGGYADDVTLPNSSGGGMYNVTGSPTVRNCDFKGNASTATVGGGGGMLNLSESNPALIDCNFIGNMCAGTGGGLQNSGSSPLIVNCVFSKNMATSSGGGISNGTPGDPKQPSNPIITNCKFISNATAGVGGAMTNGGSIPTIVNSLFTGNSANGDGGAIINGNSDPVIVNCTFSGNAANGNGGGLQNSTGSNPSITNSILWGNTDDADGDGGGPFMDESAQIFTESGMPVVTYSIVMGGWTGEGQTGNSASDPLFANENLGITSGSPAIDAGNNDALPADDSDLDNDGDTAEPTPLDIAGIARFLDDHLQPDTGNGGIPGPPIVDIGAYEFLRDCNANGVADGVDLSGCAGDPDCEDCNGNSIPDVCDIADCAPGDVTCDDCNLNGVPDDCDININMTSNDDFPMPDGDGIPDECPTNEPDASGDWTDPANWPPLNEGGMQNDDGYPDSDGDGTGTGVPDQHVTLSGVDLSLFLNESVEIDSLRILAGAELEATQVTDANPDPPDASGDLTITSPGDLFIQGGGDGLLLSQLLVANDRQIDVSNGQLTIDGNGVYQAADGATDVTANLLTSSALILEGEPVGGTMLLSDQMRVDTANDFAMDGFLVGTGTSCTPPILGMTGISLLDIGGDLIFVGGVDVSVGVDATVIVGGSIVDQSNESSEFNFLGMLIIDGGSPFGPMERRFEVSGRDAGATAEALSTGNLYGSVVVGQDATIQFVNEFPNDGNATGPLTESLYAKSLTFERGSNIVVDGCRIYHQFDLADAAASITLLNGGAIVQIGGIPAAPLADDRFDVNNTTVNCAHDGDCADLSVCRRGKCYVPTNRLLGIRPNPANAGDWAYRISFDTVVAGSIVLGFAGAPDAVVATGPGPNNYLLADIVDVGSASYQDWAAAAAASGDGYLYFSDCEIAPDSTYIIQAVKLGDDVSNELNYSNPLELPTTPFGDATNGSTVNAPPNGVANLIDVFAAVQAFQNTQGGPKHWFELEPVGASNFPVINLADVFQFVNAFSGGSYAGPDPQDCP